MHLELLLLHNTNRKPHAGTRTQWLVVRVTIRVYRNVLEGEKLAGTKLDSIMAITKSEQLGNRGRLSFSVIVGIP